ncbi:MAG: hypothetical protein ACK5BO_06170 [Bacteroidota bacterium]
MTRYKRTNGADNRLYFRIQARFRLRISLTGYFHRIFFLGGKYRLTNSGIGGGAESKEENKMKE